MTIEQLRATHQSNPFLPFTIRMADGREFPIPHPDFLSFSPVGRTAVIYHTDGSARIVDLLLMTELELSAPTNRARVTAGSVWMALPPRGSSS